MPISSINRVKTLSLSLPRESDNILVVYQNSEVLVGTEFSPGYKIVSFNTFIKNLKAFASIKSLPEISLPNFELEDTETDKLYKVLDVQWKNARKQLDLYIQSGNSDWLPIGSVSILNPSGYPFKIYNLMDLFTDNLALELGDNSKIGIAVKNVGYGFLTNGDSVVIHGSYVEEIYLESKEPPININIAGSVGQGLPYTKMDYGLSNSVEVNNISLLGN